MRRSPSAPHRRAPPAGACASRRAISRSVRAASGRASRFLRSSSSAPRNSSRSRQARRIVGAVLADSAGERDRIDAAHDRRIGADVLAHAMRIDRDREHDTLVATGRATLDLAHVVRAGEPGQSRLLLSSAVQLLRVERARPQQLKQDAGIQIAGARAHDQALRAASCPCWSRRCGLLDRGSARAVAQGGTRRSAISPAARRRCVATLSITCAWLMPWKP